MSIRVALEHRTHYAFDRPVKVGPHTVRLRPAPHCRTPITSYSLTVDPAEHFVNWQQDAHANHLARVVFPEPATSLTFTVDLVADMTVVNPFDFFLEEYAERFGFGYPAELAADLEPYLRRVEHGAPLQTLLQKIPRGDVPIVTFLVDVNRTVRDAVDYSVRLEPGVQTPDETLTRGIGSCRDSAWLLVALLRELGLAARFVSGYLVQLAPDSVPGVPAPSFHQDFTDLHAWAEVFVPGAGWIGLDATSGLLAGEGHIPLAATPGPRHAAPISGLVDPCESRLEFSNTVTRVHEDPRVTAPYSPAQRERIDLLGARIDTLLADGDVRLTMGGEPTFVSTTDMASPQWTVAADGEDKRRMADELAARLTEHYAPNGVVHRGQGKWYPGEPLPRWQTALVWRTDGAPLWHDRALLATPSEPGTSTGEDARRIAADVAARLGITAAGLHPLYEDRLH